MESYVSSSVVSLGIPPTLLRLMKRIEVSAIAEGLGASLIVRVNAYVVPASKSLESRM